MLRTGNLGSKSNPYRNEEYLRLLSTNSWKGGWVKVGMAFVYITEENFRYTEDSGVFGSYNYMIPVKVKNEMIENNIWDGGWVFETNPTKKYYFTINRHTAETDTSGCFSKDKPCPYEAFYEMCRKKMWIGGYVGTKGETVNYYESLDVEISSSNGCSGSHGSSGCGCGSGSGNIPGCGCGSSGDPSYEIEKGELILGAFSGIAGTLTAVWTAGITTGYCPDGMEYASVSAKIELVDSYCVLKSSSFSGGWQYPYTYCIWGYFDFSMNNKLYRVEINSISFTIPVEYRA